MVSTGLRIGCLHNTMKGLLLFVLLTGSCRGADSPAEVVAEKSLASKDSDRQFTSLLQNLGGFGIGVGGLTGLGGVSGVTFGTGGLASLTNSTALSVTFGWQGALFAGIAALALAIIAAILVGVALAKDKKKVEEYGTGYEETGYDTGYEQPYESSYTAYNVARSIEDAAKKYNKRDSPSVSS